MDMNLLQPSTPPQIAARVRIVQCADCGKVLQFGPIHISHGLCQPMAVREVA